MFEAPGYCTVPSPLGELFVAATAEGLYRICWSVSEDEFMAALEAGGPQNGQRAWPPTGDRGALIGSAGVCPGTGAEGADSSPLLREAARQIGEYFDGQRREFSLRLDLAHLRPFQRGVLLALLQVPYGEVVTYGGLAVLSGCPGAARAVGGAMRGNPLPILIPCHRVLPCSGGLGGFGGRPDLKRRLLELEGWGQDLDNLGLQTK
jgi:methylated-DNA-[protein]-cysteine S-methyltransferase